MTDHALSDAYRASVSAMDALARSLAPEQLAQPIPATPGWTAHQVLAHAAGVCGDFVCGNMAGAPGDAWTAAHVAARDGVAVADLLDEVDAATDSVVAAIDSGQGTAFAFDRATHLADLHEGFGLSRPDSSTWAALGATLIGGQPDDVQLRLTAADPYEVFRALVSRRSRAQIRAWGLELDDAQIEGLGIFGGRDDDQPLPR